MQPQNSAGRVEGLRSGTQKAAPPPSLALTLPRLSLPHLTLHTSPSSHASPPAPPHPPCNTPRQGKSQGIRMERSSHCQVTKALKTDETVFLVRGEREDQYIDISYGHIFIASNVYRGNKPATRLSLSCGGNCVKTVVLQRSGRLV